jgi:hypothetical protein
MLHRLAAVRDISIWPSTNTDPLPAQKFGLSYDSNDPDAGRSRKSLGCIRLLSLNFCVDWTMLTAATVKDQGVRNNLLDMVYTRAASNATFGILPVRYQVGNGNTAEGFGR